MPFVANLHESFYRVSIKALVFDDAQRLLMFKTPEGWEVPGGGWEHDESIERCLRRELQEEAGVDIIVDAPDKPRFVFQAHSKRWGYQGLRIVYDAHLVDSGQPLKPGDGMIVARFVTKDELLALPFVSLDEPIKQLVDQIWP